MSAPCADRHTRRRGLSALEVVLSLATIFVIALVAYWMVERSCGGLYHVISTITGSPYL